MLTYLPVTYLRGVWRSQFFSIPANHCHAPFSKAFSLGPKLPPRLTFTQQVFLDSNGLVKDVWKANTLGFENSEMNSLIENTFLTVYLWSLKSHNMGSFHWESVCFIKEPEFCNQNWPLFNTVLHYLETLWPSKATYAF